QLAEKIRLPSGEKWSGLDAYGSPRERRTSLPVAASSRHSGRCLPQATARVLPSGDQATSTGAELGDWSALVHRSCPFLASIRQTPTHRKKAATRLPSGLKRASPNEAEGLGIRQAARCRPLATSRR